MVCSVTVAAGVGTQYGRMAAFDPGSTVNITGLAADFFSRGVAGHLTTIDGATSIGDAPTGTVGIAGAVTLTFDLDTAACANLFPAYRRTPVKARLTVVDTLTAAVACTAEVLIVPAYTL